MNLPKFIKDDERLFRLLLGDLFPSLDLPVSEYGTLGAAIEVELEKAGLQKVDFQLFKIFQFYDSRLTRHCNMLVGVCSYVYTRPSPIAYLFLSYERVGSDGR